MASETIEKPKMPGLVAPTRPNLAGKPLYVCRPEDEFLHAPAPSGHYSATETSYYGFNIPEQNLNGEIYMWFHPVLGMCSASVYIWRGFKATTLSCEYVNHYHYLPMPKDGIADYRVSDDMDLRFKVIEPLKTVQVVFNDPDRGVSFDIVFNAIMPPAGRPDGFHYTQAMKTNGTLDLFGEKLTIDGYFSRDHSWSQERRETSRKAPPVAWMVGVFGDDLAFHAVGFDDPKSAPEVVERYPFYADMPTLGWGYIWSEGELVPLAEMKKSTVREADGLSPKSFELTLTDVRGRRFDITGVAENRMPWQTWQNMNVYFCLTRWTLNGRTGWGDTQDIQMNDFVHAFDRR